MGKPNRKADQAATEPLVKFLMQATDCHDGEAEGDHLDENELALLERQALSPSEADTVRRHLRGCAQCRLLVSQILAGPTGGGHGLSDHSPTSMQHLPVNR